MKRIFISGGGSEKDSVLVDRAFVSSLDKSKTLIYIPNAMSTNKYKSCKDWFVKVFSNLGILNIKMFTNLNEVLDLDEVSGIYIGGGNTVKLRNEVYGGDFDKALRAALEGGISIYGGSAGAIILGKDIRSSPEGKENTEADSFGLDFFSSHMIHCHFDPSSDEADEIQKRLRRPLIAISERSGAYIEDGVMRVIGFEPIIIIRDNGRSIIKPNETYPLSACL